MFETTRVYLQRVLPWIDGAYVNLHWTSPNKKFDASKPEGPRNKKFWLNGQAFQSPDALISYLGYLMGRADTLDIYVCMSAQSVAQEKAFGNSGRTYLSAQRGLAFSAGHKSLYLDLDVKPDDLTHGYATTQDAFQALAKFLADSGMPRPTLAVSSGTGGAHAYWAFDKVIPLAEWTPLANALAEATRRHGLRTDTQCIVDGVRILRPPETFNRKREAPLPVVMGQSVQPGDISVDHLRKVLTPYMGAKVLTLPTAGKAMAPGLNSELSGGIQAGLARPVELNSVASQCGFVRNGLASGGAQFAQPLWNIATLLASFTMAMDGDGREIAHRLAKGHPTYVQADTDALYDRKMNERNTRNIGWPSCASVENAGCTDCSACPLRPLNKSPLSFGTAYSAPVASLAAPSPLGLSTSSVQAAGAAPVNPAAAAGHMPPGYHVSPTGIISRIATDPNGNANMIQVSPYPMHSAWLQSNPWVLHFVTRLGNSVLETSLSMSLTNLQSREYGKHLAAQGLVTNKNQSQELQEFLLSWVQTLQTIKDAVVSSSPFGWSLVNSKIDGFVYNSRVWTASGDKPAATPNPVLEEHYRPHGELQPWKDAAAFLTSQQRPALDAILAAGFGACLMRFTGQSGVIMSAYSQATGIGKSTFMQVTQAIWAHPKKAMQGLTDTNNAVANKAGQLRNLPLLWDELKGEDQKNKFVTLAFQISEGKEKSRLNSDSTQRDPGTWQTMVIAASNDSLQDTIQRQIRTNEAGMVRVFEFEVPVSVVKSAHGHAHVSRLVSRCQDNYGQAGLVYAKFLGTEHARISDEVSKLSDMLVTRLGASNDERFWIAAMVCIILGAKYANELGLTTINEQGLFRFLVAALNKQRSHRSVSAVDVSRPDALGSILAQYLAEKATRNTLTTDFVHLGKGRPSQVANALGDHSRLEDVQVRHAKDQKLLILAKAPFQEWLHKREYQPFTVIDAMSKLWNVVPNAQRTLTSGTAWANAGFKTYCLEIDYSGSNFAAIVDP